MVAEEDSITGIVQNQIICIDKISMVESTILQNRTMLKEGLVTSLLVRIMGMDVDITIAIITAAFFVPSCTPYPETSPAPT